MSTLALGTLHVDFTNRYCAYNTSDRMDVFPEPERPIKRICIRKERIESAFVYAHAAS